jgi:acetolactate synthase-1/2/3 large subunit
MTKQMRVADYLPKFIRDRGVRHVFMLSGGGIMHLTDGLACNRDIEAICLHHEQAVSMAVEAYARHRGGLGAAYFTTGPGATNALTGLAGAWLDSVPCLFVSGQVKRKETVYRAGIPALRQIGVQEINILPIVRSIAKYAAFVDDPNDIRYHLEKAAHMAAEGRPGPVWLDIPLDVQGATIDPAKLKGFTAGKRPSHIPAASIRKAAECLLSASRPVLLAGQGVRISGAVESMLKFVERYRIPVVTTYLGVDLIDSRHPYYVGRIGIKGDRAGNYAMQNSDLLIVIGASLTVAETGYEYAEFARGARTIVVDIDETSHKKKTVRIDLFIKGDAKEFLDRTNTAVGWRRLSIDPKWPHACREWREKYPVCLPEYAALKDKINIYYFVERLSGRLTPRDIVVSDAGSAFYAVSQCVKIKRGLRYITSGGFATMGYSVPASIGISIAAGRKRVMCITGDGSFQQNLQELQSIVHHKLPIKIFILNNDGYLSIRFTQERHFNGRFIGEGRRSGVSFPDSRKIARAYGIKFIRASDNRALDRALAETLAWQGPVICEIMTPRDQLVIPTVASQKLANGTMASSPLEDMYPFLDREEFRKNMFVEPTR